ncbi:DNA polymerase III subunit gamma/tau [Tepidibacter formicigenes]|jgi:DNA polymerase-3 subunit gamma/tau|uniref:DNA-directed DNA polymerase n=1 Tax=Tepidibacter formicigenes DSM 15518 TaxID=1123349 RepID=A0A1M6QA68_9FIRM|nr:DNA polymerase III subunit gamma/tau [Tepidibacter formicigenes]SHK17184.1 DNA polymerase-3 subunit gamma/tau [Tepidibacter formicigenes DSM 15518]
MHKALYRVYRPLNFKDVIGQEHVTKTLKNQIENNNIAHAYLFSGTRGTGKTSTAKIFARAVNCLNPKDKEPCNECEVCKGILTDNIMDVIEIDAASNNGVDDIRELRENVKYPPTKGRYKVYIIDEVHMLSQGAFNALLKTLEEPPSYIIFILATTEPHKIPATILSRCQKFDFKRVQVDDIITRMKNICSDINIEVDEKALNLIARNSGGALRDALSILDQCISYSESKVEYEDVVSLLGTVNIDFLFKMSDYIINEDTKSGLELLNELVIWGKDIKHFLDDLVDHFRNLMICKVSSELNEIINLPIETIDILRKQSNKIELNNIIRIINILSDTQSNIKYSSNPRILAEITIIKLSQPILDGSSESILKRINKIESIINNGVNIVKTTTVSDSKNEEAKINKKNIVRDIKDPNVEEIEKLWPEILSYMKKDKNMSVQAMLREVKNFNIQGNILGLIFNDEFKFIKDRLSRDENKNYIEKVINEVTNQNLKVKISLKSELIDFKEEKEDKGIKILEDMFAKDIIEVKNSIKEI